MEIVAKTDIGQKRELNEDALGFYYNQQQKVLLIVCDGVGGHKAGEVASSMTVSYIGEAWQQTKLDSLEETHQWLLKIIKEANEVVYQQSLEQEEYSGMGTTLVCGTVVDGEWLIANVGDSRAYLFRQDKMKQITEDHSLVNELLKSGEITEEEALVHPKRNIVTRSIGVFEHVQIDFAQVSLKDQDQLLLCSDGLSNMLSDQEIQDILQSDRTLEMKVEACIHKANEMGGKDNISVLLVCYEVSNSREGDES